MVEIPIIASVISALLGAFFGSIGTYILQRRKEQRDQEDLTKQLRKGLLADLESMGFFDDWRKYYDNKSVPAQEIASSKYFEAVTPELGYLSESETTSIMDFYSGLENVNNMVKWNYNLTNEIITNPDIKLDEKERIERNKKLLKSINSLDDSRDEAIKTIKDDLQ